MKKIKKIKIINKSSLLFFWLVLIAAIFFLVTQLMEGQDYLTWEQAREISRNGLFTIGDHTLCAASASAGRHFLPTACKKRVFVV